MIDATEAKRKSRAVYNRKRREDAKVLGLCSTCTSKKPERKPGPDVTTCDVCMRKGPDRRPTPRQAKTGRPKSYLVPQGEQKGDEVVKLARKPVATGKCSWKGCKAKPDGEGFVYCRIHGCEYAQRLRRPSEGGEDYE